MLDISLVRNDLATVAAGLAKRGLALDTAAFEALERERKDLQTRTQELQSRRNTLSKEIGIAIFSSAFDERMRSASDGSL